MKRKMNAVNRQTTTERAIEIVNFIRWAYLAFGILLLLFILLA